MGLTPLESHRNLFAVERSFGCLLLKAIPSRTGNVWPVLEVKNAETLPAMASAGDVAAARVLAVGKAASPLTSTSHLHQTPADSVSCSLPLSYSRP